MLLEVIVQEGLEGAYRQLHPGIGHCDGAGVAFVGIGDGVALPFSLVGAGVIGLQGLQHLLRLHAEDTAVNGLELEGIVVVVHHLD